MSLSSHLNWFVTDIGDRSTALSFAAIVDTIERMNAEGLIRNLKGKEIETRMIVSGQGAGGIEARAKEDDRSGK